MARIVVMGGGLAGGLFAFRMKQARPDVVVTLVEREPALGGTHTWCFFDADLTRDQNTWIAPFVAHRWAGYTVTFRDQERALGLPYNAITSERFDRVCREALGDRCLLSSAVSHFDATSVTLEDGKVLTADAVVDARGAADMRAFSLAYQKFLGLEVRLSAPHGLAMPCLMDGSVPQIDGFRFIYSLPFSADRLLIEDTRYSDDAILDSAALRPAVLDYAAARGWRIEDAPYEESGVLPIVLGGNFARFWADGPGIARLGLRAGLFHATTGYSLPETLRMIDCLVAIERPAAETFWHATRDGAHAAWRQQRYFRMLNRMLFRAAAPAERHRVFAHFYRLPEPLIARFFAGRLSFTDQARILIGRPPVSVGAALKALAARPT